jgi:hypothetical protein
MSKQFDLIGCVQGFLGRNSIYINGEAKQIYTSQGQALFGIEKQIPHRFQTICIGYVQILELPVYRYFL